MPLLDAGTNWYDARAEIEFIMEDAGSVELLVTPIDGTGKYTQTLRLPELPQRPFRSFRFSFTAEMQSERGLFVCIKDEGFGDFYEKLPVGMTYDIILGEKGTI